MDIKNIRLKNFRGYKDLKLDFNKNFNLIIGNNGSGKTAVLEALTVAIGSFFLGIRNVNSRHILNKDIHIHNFEYNEEHLFPVIIEAEGEINHQKLKWTRELNGLKNKTTSIKAKDIKRFAQDIDNQIREGAEIYLPLLVYYTTGRLFDEVGDKEEKQGKTHIASRFRAYNRCLEAKSTYKIFLKWFKGKELSKNQKGKDDINFELVKEAIISNVPNCVNIFYEIDPDRQQGLKIQLADKRILPFHSLSDGTRNFLAIIGDISYKCVTLNPHLKNNALLKTRGIVLIDELDLHLHPDWQQRIIHSLRNTFPNIQFIVTSHSPFLIQETGINQLIMLKDNSVEKIGSAINLSIEDIAEEIQYVENPQWSKTRQKMFEVAGEYYKAVNEGTDTDEMKDKLDEVMLPFANDTAFYSIIEQLKIKKERKNIIE
ncbi:MAG: AAA family ATPase [Bacteroidetes bacterium]|jgi:predicted ATP-binding protein involved in virulence|nr:AAA family ATPase [Bacteroidota bacterium]MBT6687469.1 AAA family ATPase [Bacteroidota bacterium]MBT7142655.1 AAA family ATPase [Bacteroidota bacterium]MBT7493056.1 AAA family ATPase [Bacteroidota bacterium]